MAIIQISKIMVRSGNLSDIPQLDGGELGFAQDQRRLFIGNDDTRPGDPQPPVPNNTELLTQYSPIDGTQIRGNITAAGQNTQVQFNSDGVLAGSSALTIEQDTPNNRSDITVSNANVVVQTTSNLEVGINHLYITPEMGSNVVSGFSLLLTNAATGATEWAPISGNGIPIGNVGDVQYKVSTTEFGGAPGFQFSGAGNLANTANTPNTLTVASANRLIVNGNLQGTGNFDFSASGDVNLGAVANISIANGLSGQYLQTDGNANLSWSTVSLSNINNGNSNVTVLGNAGNVGVSINGNANVVVFTTDGITTSAINNGNSNILLAPNSNVAVSVAGNSNIVVFTADGISTDANIIANVTTVNTVNNVSSLLFNTTSNITANTLGLMYWSNTDQTINIQHQNVIQQVGQEQLVLARNETGSNINLGTLVGIAGAGANRLTVAPYTANGSQSSLSVLGLTSQTIANGAAGFVTTFGIANANTSSFAVGELLYASASAGALSNVRPTAPNIVVPVATVLNSNANGQVFVRPTVQQKLDNGRFVRITSQTAGSANSATVVQFTNTDPITSGMNLDVGNTQITATKSGSYQFNVTAQVASTDSTPRICYMWLRKQGADIANSTRRVTVDSTNNPFTTLAFVWTVSLDATEYVEVIFAVESTGVTLDGSAATVFAPATAAVTADVVQTQL